MPIDAPIPPLQKMKLCRVGKDVRCPFPEGDKRLLLWSLSRPTWIKPDQLGYDYNRNISVTDRQKVYPRKVLWDQNVNGYVVPYNDLLTYLDGCNTAIYPLGSSEAAKVKTFYMTKYVVKEQGAFKKLLSVAKTAHNLTTDHPNIFFGDDNESANNPPLNNGMFDSTTPGNISSVGADTTSQRIPCSLTSEEYNSVKRFGNTLLNSLRST